MPYIDNPEFVWPDPMAYDVLVQDPEGATTLLTAQPDKGGLMDSANAAVEAHRESTGADVTLVDAWVTGGRVWATSEPAPSPMRPSAERPAGGGL